MTAATPETAGHPPVAQVAGRFIGELLSEEAMCNADPGAMVAALRDVLLAPHYMGVDQGALKVAIERFLDEHFTTLKVVMLVLFGGTVTAVTASRRSSSRS
jgi:hypothetical protein